MSFHRKRKQPLSVKEKAVDYLSRREYARNELARKLIANGYSVDEVNSTLDLLAEHGWQSDERYTELLINTRSRQGYGPQRIEMELRHNGVSDLTIQAQLDPDDLRWRDQLGILWRRKISNGRADIGRLQRYFIRRGFQPYLIYELIKSGDSYVDVDEPN